MLIRSNACIIMLLSNLFVFYQVTYVWATSKTWTQALKNLDPEKPGPRKTWILKNLDPETPGPKKTCTLKNLDPLLRIKSLSVKFSKYQRQSSGGVLKIFAKFIEKYQKYP